MVIILFMCMLVIPWVIGSGILRILYKNRGTEEFSLCDALLTGWIAVIGTAEAAHILAVFGRLSLTHCVALFGGLTVLQVLLSLAVWFWTRFRKGAGSGKSSIEKPSLLFVFPALLLISQMAYILLAGGIYLSRDMTMETVVSFLYTDGIYQVNPLTGSVYEGGIPFRLEILCLPTLYSVLCRIFLLDPQTVVWLVTPCITLICCYGAFRCVGRSLFPESVKRQDCFLAVVAALLWVGSYAFGMDGFGVLYSGWRGVVIRNAVLIPYLFSLCLRRKWKLIILCIAAEVCIVWTFYGAGACLLLTAGMTACRFAVCRAQGGRENGKEAAE